MLFRSAQGLNLVTINGAALQHHLEAVVVFGVVAARDLNAAVAQGVRGKVEHGRGNHADINHLYAHIHQALNERSGKFGAAQAPVAPNGHGVAAQLAGAGAKGAPQAAGEVCR